MLLFLLKTNHLFLYYLYPGASLKIKQTHNQVMNPLKIFIIICMNNLEQLYKSPNSPFCYCVLNILYPAIIKVERKMTRNTKLIIRDTISLIGDCKTTKI